MKPARLHRFKRSAAVTPIRRTARDGEIIQLVHRHRFLQSSQITALLAGSLQQLVRRLQLLYHHGFLERPRAQLNYYCQGGSRPMVYGLGKEGVALLKHELGPAFRHSRLAENNRAVSRIFLEHALLVSEIMVAIELACRKSGRFRFIAEDELRRDGLRPPFRWNVRVRDGLNLGVVPDRVFALEWPDENGKPTRSFFFLEADRGTMPVTRRTLSQTSLYRKLLAYEATWSQSIHEKRFGFHRFRVITVTTSAERVKALLAACSRLEHGHGLFLFADRTILEKPGDILSTVWRSGKDGLTGSPLD